MTEHFTREEAAALAKAAGFEVRRGLGLRESVPEDVFARGLINEEVQALCNAAVNAKLKEWEARGAVAYVKFKDGAVNFESDNNIVISNTPGDCMDESIEWKPVFTHPLPARQGRGSRRLIGRQTPRALYESTHTT